MSFTLYLSNSVPALSAEYITDCNPILRYSKINRKTFNNLPQIFSFSKLQHSQIYQITLYASLVTVIFPREIERSKTTYAYSTV